jgi:L-ascorbate metabolism protein UlaG (beta-lactamase superfamily)
MMSARLLCSVILSFLFNTSVNAQQNDKTKISITPVSHASFVMNTGQTSIFVDPVGKAEAFAAFPAPDLILITHAHGDHLSLETIEAVKDEKTLIISAQAVYDELQQGTVLTNGQKTTVLGIEIEAIPMYNINKDRLQFHPRGRGNGYVLTIDDQRIYISGDTEDIPEMRELKDIDYAIICMNLPYTMSVEQAASAVLEMKPRVVIPYHYRGTDGFSDLEKFKTLVSEDKDIEVQLLDWYK